MTRAEIERLGYRVTQQGACWCVKGRGVDLRVATLSMVSIADLRPAVVGAWDRSAQERTR